jgi:DNA-binding CsgD family transcriptional regulator
VVPDTIATRRTRPSVVILDAGFGLHLAHPERQWLAAEPFRDAARRIVTDKLDRLDVAFDGGAYVVRVAHLRGPDPMSYAMFVEHRGSRRPLLDAYDRFGLSAREVEVLALIVDGASNREIAEALCVVPGTVQDHVHSICTKSGAKRRGDLMARVFGVDQP